MSWNINDPTEVINKYKDKGYNEDYLSKDIHRKWMEKQVESLTKPLENRNRIRNPIDSWRLFTYQFYNIQCNPNRFLANLIGFIFMIHTLWFLLKNMNSNQHAGIIILEDIANLIITLIKEFRSI